MAARITGASLDPILTRLNGVDNYHPLDADTFSDWSIEAGDLVTVSRDGVQYKSPVHTSTMTWKGTTPQVQIRSTGKETRDPVSVASRKKYGRGSSALLNSQQAYRDITTSYNNMKAGLILASSAASLYVEDMYNQMKSGLDLTSSSASLYVEDRYNQMKAGLDLTSSSASLYVDDAYNKMKAGLDLTSSSASLYVDSKYNQMKAGLDLASSSAALYVQDAYNRMKSGLDVTSSSAALYTESKTTRAAIMTRINADGEGEALIEADKVSITGATTINSALIINNDGDMVVKKNAVFQGNMLLQTTGSKLKIGSGTSLEFLGTSTYSMTNADLATTIKDASVSGNTLTLTRYNGTTLTFEKAASMSGSWSSGSFPLTVTDDLDTYTIGIGGVYGAHDVELEVVTNGNATKDSIVAQTVDVPIKVAELNDGAASTTRYSKTLAVAVGDLLESKTITSISGGPYTPDSDHIGFSQITVNISLDDADVEAAAANAEKSVRVRSKSGSTYGSYKTMAMSQGTYTPQGQTASHDCIVVKDSDGSTVVGRYDINTYGTNKYNSGKTDGWDACFDTYDDSGTSATGTLSYGGSAVVSVKLKNSSGTVISKTTRTYTAPADRYNTGYSDGQSAAWINYVPGPPYSKTAQGTIAAGRWVYPGTSGNMWWTASPWFGYTDTKGSNHQGTLGGHKYIRLVTLDYNGAVSDPLYDNATWEIPSGSSYTKYTFSKARTQSSDGYHYTFSIGTGWQTPFGASGGTYDLYKKD